MSRIHPYTLPLDPYHALHASILAAWLAWKAKVSQLVIIRTVHYLGSVVRENKAMTPRRDIFDQWSTPQIRRYPILEPSLENHILGPEHIVVVIVFDLWNGSQGLIPFA